MNAWPSDWLSIVADLLGIIGFFITVVVSVVAFEIRGQIKRKQLLPLQQADLSAHAIVLDGYRAEYAAAQAAIDIEMGRIEGVLVPLRSNLKNKGEKAVVGELLASFSAYRKLKTEAQFIEVCSRLEKLTRVTGYSVKEMEWE